MFKLVLEKAEEPEIKSPTFAGSWKKRVSEKQICHYIKCNFSQEFGNYIKTRNMPIWTTTVFNSTLSQFDKDLFSIYNVLSI